MSILKNKKFNKLFFLNMRYVYLISYYDINIKRLTKKVLYFVEHNIG